VELAYSLCALYVEHTHIYIYDTFLHKSFCENLLEHAMCVCILFAVLSCAKMTNKVQIGRVPNNMGEKTEPLVAGTIPSH
jgi:hypothetical protein